MPARLQARLDRNSPAPRSHKASELLESEIIDLRASALARVFEMNHRADTYTKRAQVLHVAASRYGSAPCRTRTRRWRLSRATLMRCVGRAPR